MNTWQRLKAIPIWIWLVVLAASLRLVNLGSESLWYDEAGTLLTVKLPFDRMMAAVANDVHPPLWYIIEWINVRLLGTSEFAFRLPATALSVVAVLLVWRIALAIGVEKRTAMLAGILAAIIPASIYYGQDARMYPLLACCVLGAALAAIHNKRWLFVLCAIGAIDAQYVGLFYISALGCAWLGWPFLDQAMTDRYARVNLVGVRYKLIAFASIIVAWSPWSSIFFHQVEAVKSNFWIQPLNLAGIISPVVTMTLGERFPPGLFLFVGIVAFGLTLIGLASRPRWDDLNHLLVFAIMLMTPIGIAMQSAVWQRTIYLPRALLPATLLLMIFWAVALTKIAKEDRPAALMIATPVILLAIFSHYFPGNRGRFPVRDWAAEVRAGWRSGDVIYNLTEGSAVPYGVYLDELPAYLMPDGSHLAQGGLTVETRALLGFKQATFEQVVATGQFRRAWVTISTSPTMQASENEAAAAILSNYSCTTIRADSDQLGGTTLYLCRLALTL